MKNKYTKIEVVTRMVFEVPNSGFMGKKGLHHVKQRLKSYASSPLGWHKIEIGYSNDIPNSLQAKRTRGKTKVREIE